MAKTNWHYNMHWVYEESAESERTNKTASLSRDIKRNLLLFRMTNLYQFWNRVSTKYVYTVLGGSILNPSKIPKDFSIFC